MAPPRYALAAAEAEISAAWASDVAAWQRARAPLNDGWEGGGSRAEAAHSLSDDPAVRLLRAWAARAPEAGVTARAGAKPRAHAAVGAPAQQRHALGARAALQRAIEDVLRGTTGARADTGLR